MSGRVVALIAALLTCAESRADSERVSVADLLQQQTAQSSPSAAPIPTINAARSAGDLVVTIDPALWMARVRGNASWLGPTFTVDDDFGLNGYEATLNGELTASWGVFYEVMVTGWYFSTDSTTTAQVGGAFGPVNIAVGDQLSNSFSAASAGAEFDVTLFQPFADQKSPWSPIIPNDRNTAEDGWYKADLRFKGICALRWYSASLSVSDQTAGSTASWSMDAVMPGVGGGVEIDFNMKGHIPIVESFRLEASGLTGTNFTDGQYFTAIRASMIGMLSPAVGVEFGYRLENFKLDDGATTFDGGVQGLFLGVHVEF